MDGKVVEEGMNSSSEKDHPPPSLVSTECTSLPEVDHGEWDDPKAHFGQEFVRFWPFRLLKTANWVLLLLITVLAIVCASSPVYDMNWSSCWDFVRSIYSNFQYWHGRERMAVLAGVLLLMATLSKFLHWIGRRAHRNSSTKANPSFLPFLGVTDLCFSIIFCLNLLTILWNFGVRAVAEYHWYFPKLTNESTTLAELTDWTGDANRRYYWDRDYHRWLTTTTRPPTTQSAYDIRLMEDRKNVILMRLMLDPAISLLALLAILVNLANVCAIRSAFKRTKCWVANYRRVHPQCSELDAAYAQFFPFGLLKLAQWFLPASFFFCAHSGVNQSLLFFGPISIFCFLRWLSYLGKVRFHPAGAKEDNSATQQVHKLAQTCKMDCVLSFVGILVYLVVFNSMGYRQTIIRGVPLFAAFLFLCSLCLTFRLLYRYGGPNGYYGFGLNVPAISVNISIKVVKREEAGGEGKKEKAKEVGPNVV